jgi:hypothetical protein
MQDRQMQQEAAGRDQVLADLKQDAGLYMSAPPELKQHLYGRIRANAEKAGFAPPGQLPQALDTPQAQEGFSKFIAHLAGPTQGEEQFTLAPGSTRYAADGSVIAAQPFAPQRPEFVLSPDGTQWLPKPMGPSQQGDLGPTIADPVTQGFDSLHAAVPGLRVTSGMRTPEQNRAAGGVSNSFHLTGQAIDIGTPTPEQRARIKQWAAQNDYEVIDKYQDGHVHLEPRSRGAQPPTGGAIPIPGAIPKPQESEIEKRIRLARQAGASEEDVKRILIGREGAAAGAKPLPTQALGQLLNVEDALGGAKSVAAIIRKHADRMVSGDLIVGPTDAVGARFRTAIGMSNDKDVNLNEFKADLTRIVNESLRLNAGVQTEGDAQRATQELMAANDQATAARALKRLSEINRRAVELQKRKQAVIRKNYGQDADGNPLGQRQPPQSDDDVLIGKYL